MNTADADSVAAARVLRAAGDAMTRAGWPVDYGRHLRVAAAQLADEPHPRDRPIVAAILAAAREVRP